MYISKSAAFSMKNIGAFAFFISKFLLELIQKYNKYIDFQLHSFKESKLQ